MRFLFVGLWHAGALKPYVSAATLAATSFYVSAVAVWTREHLVDHT